MTYTLLPWYARVPVHTGWRLRLLRQRDGQRQLAHHRHERDVDLHQGAAAHLAVGLRLMEQSVLTRDALVKS